MTDEMKQRIDKMTHVEMAYAWRFAGVGAPMFQGEVGDYFKARFDELGGFSPAISKTIGWDKP